MRTLVATSTDDARIDWSARGLSKFLFISDQGGNRDIYLGDTTGRVTNLTNNPATDDWPAWSPDGSKIAFTSNRAATSRSTR